MASPYAGRPLLGKEPAVFYCVHQTQGKPTNFCHSNQREQGLPKSYPLLSYLTEFSGASVMCLAVHAYPNPRMCPKFHTQHVSTWQSQWAEVISYGTSFHVECNPRLPFLLAIPVLLSVLLLLLLLVLALGP